MIDVLSPSGCLFLTVVSLFSVTAAAQTNGKYQHVLLISIDGMHSLAGGVAGASGRPLPLCRFTRVFFILKRLALLGGLSGSGGSQILRRQTRVFRNLGQHARTNFFTIMKAEHIVSMVGMGQLDVRPALGNFGAAFSQ